MGQVGKIEELETGSRFFLDSTGTGFEVARTQVMTNVVQCNLFQGFSGLQEVGSRQENFGVRRINVEASTGAQFVTRTLQYSFRDTLGSQTTTVFGKDTTSKKILKCHNIVIMKLHEVVFPLLSHLTARRTACP